MKKFLITVDTEGDNLWSWKLGDEIKTENAKYLPRFQELCELFGFIPTYLINYEMAADDFLVKYFKPKIDLGLCEIGMHLHAWNSPPLYNLPVRTDVLPGAPFLIEYPTEIMDEKISFITNYIENRFDVKPVSHRAGRWAMNEKYFQLLNKYGYKVDCSVTPGISWNCAYGQSPGSLCTNYSDYSKKPYRVAGTNILEVPVSIRDNHRIDATVKEGIRKYIKKAVAAKKNPGKIWIRPRNTSGNLQDMLWLVNNIYKEKDNDYLMFMIHSSELMPGGSPSFKNKESIEKLYDEMIVLFRTISNKYIGQSLSDYAKN